MEEEKKIEPVEMDEKLLTDAEKKAVEDFSHKIDIRDTNMILQYGAAAQKSVAGFLRKRPEQRPQQGPGRDRQGPEPAGGGAEGLRRGGGKRRAWRAYSEGRQPAGDHEGPVRQGGGQRGQNRPEPGAAPDHPAEGCGHV